MTILGFRCGFGLCAAATILAACGGSQPPIGGSGTMQQMRAIAMHTEHSRSWMLPAPKSGNLLYVSDTSASEVFVFSYPAGRHVGTLTGFQANPQGLCTDRSGNVFVTDQVEILEYAHGGTKPINILTDSEYPIACAVDPSTGNLAVANEKDGSVSIYPNATGNPTIYSVPFVPLFCAYDDSGNLFADSSGAPGISIAKLAKGGDAFQKVAYNTRNNGEPAGLAWVGKYLAVGSASPYQRRCCGRIFHFLTSGTHARRVGRTLLDGPINDFFVEGATAIVSTGFNRVAVYDYPMGAHPKKIIKEPGYQSYSVTVSLAPH